MEFIKWCNENQGFVEIAISVLTFVIGIAFGGTVGYKVGVKNKNKQTQKARDNSNQIQIGSITNINGKE